MSWEQLIGNNQVKARLQAALRENHLGHALIFSGPDGVGKRQFALSLAKAVNCQEVEADSCDRCNVCHKIDEGIHVDVALVEPDGAFIKVGQVRRIVEESYYRPLESLVRVFILDPAEAMNEQAANALLKTLEEPPGTSLLILIARTLHTLLPTIRSRCQIYAFAPLRVEEVEAFLRAHSSRPETETRLLARLSAGRIGRALEIDLPAYQSERKQMLELLKLLGSANDRTRLIRAAEYLGRKLSRPEFERRLEVLSILLRDVFCLLIQGASAELVNFDAAPALMHLAEHWSVERIDHFIRKLEILRLHLQQNIHRQVALDDIFLVEMRTLSPPALPP